MAVTAEAVAQKVARGEPLTKSEWAFSRKRLETLLRKAAVIKRPEFTRLVKAKRFIERKTPTYPPEIFQRTRFERGMLICAQRPIRVDLYDKVTKKKVHELFEVERRCRDFPEEDVDCYETAVTSHRLVEGEEPSTCEKVKVALACVGSVSPTVAAALINQPKDQVQMCLEDKLRAEGHVDRKGAEEIPPHRLKKVRKEVLRKDFFLDEPLYFPNPSQSKETLKKYEKLREAVPV